MSELQFSEVTETFHPVSECRGVVYGYTFGYRLDQGGVVYAWCQYSRRNRRGFETFGAIQPSETFDTLDQARAWFKGTAAHRVEQNRDKWTRNGHRVVGLK